MSELLDWLTGRPIDLAGRKKIVRAAGVQSRSGDAARQLAGFGRYLQREHGFVGDDFIEATYRGQTATNGDWTPAPYQATDCEVPLAQSTALVENHLRWLDARLPLDIELHLVGYSLGGVVLFGAASALVAADRRRWGLRLASVITLASPLFGTDLGVEGELLGLFGLGALVPGGAVGRELCALGGDPSHRERVLRQAELLRGCGIELLTLADEFDTIVTPDDAVIAPPAERQRFVLATSRARQSGAYGDAVLGHGPLLENPKAWAMMAEVIGSQERRS